MATWLILANKGVLRASFTCIRILSADGAACQVRRCRMGKGDCTVFPLGEASRTPCPRVLPRLALSLDAWARRSEEHTSELQSLTNLVCRLLLEKKNIHFENPPGPRRQRQPR